MNTARIVLVISDGNDPRIQKVAAVFAELEIELTLCSASGNTWSSIGITGEVGAPRTKNLPNRTDILLMHGSDYGNSIQRVNSQLTEGRTSSFVFNGSGDPPSIDGFQRIIRPTDVSGFGLTKKHAKEIIDYTFSSGEPAMLPSCCYPTAKHLVALDILAQGFLFAHGLLELPKVQITVGDEAMRRRRELTEMERWWLDGLGVKTSKELETKLIEDHVSSTNAEEISRIVCKCCQQPDYSDDTESSQRHPFQSLRTEIAALLQ